MLKYSRQRESIKNFLATRYDHPTAETVYQNIRKEFPNISLGTVYRNWLCSLKLERSGNFPLLPVRIALTGTPIHTIILSAIPAEVCWIWM